MKTKWNYTATFGLAADQLLWECRPLQSNYGPLSFLPLHLTIANLKLIYKT